MKRLGPGVVLVVTVACGLLLRPSDAAAQNALSISDTVASAGATGVVIPIDLTLDQDISLLRFDVTFNSSLCAALVNPNGIVVRKAGRTVKDPEEQPVVCSSGLIQIAVVDITGGTVIPQGTGEVLEIVLGDLTPGATGAFTLTPGTIQALRGPATVVVTGAAGTLTINPAVTTTTVATTTTTVATTTTTMATTTTVATTTTTVATTTTTVATTTTTIATTTTTVRTTTTTVATTSTTVATTTTTVATTTTTVRTTTTTVATTSTTVATTTTTVATTTTTVRTTTTTVATTSTTVRTTTTTVATTSTTVPTTTTTIVGGDHPPDCRAASAMPSQLWPPNHSFVGVTVTGVTDPDGDPVTITITGVTQDEPVAGSADALGVGSSVVSLRADRQGQGDGRVYHVSFTANDGRGGQCSGTVTVCVPHDQRPGHGCGDNGPIADSASPGCDAGIEAGCAAEVEVALARAHCAGEPVPAALSRRIAKVRAQLARVARSRKTRHLTSQLQRSLARAARLAALAGKNGSVSSGCAETLASGLATAEARAARWSDVR